MKDHWLSTVRIRLLREEDLPALEWDGEYRRYRRIYREVYRNSQKGLSVPLVAETAEDGLVGQVFLSQKDPNPYYNPVSRYYFLSSFRVKPQFRDHGLGSLLLQACEKQTRLHHLRDIFLNCAMENNRARWFYEEHGFRVVRVDESDWSFVDDEGFVITEHQNACLMKKTLSLFSLR
ncbi:MAG: GNAT family N-acetyltransferase [Anaerolineaceae bacterium]|nr:GNAT family N-acetyltransferase [Anaerolineaceae bacterium]